MHLFTRDERHALIFICFGFAELWGTGSKRKIQNDNIAYLPIKILDGATSYFILFYYDMAIFHTINVQTCDELMNAVICVIESL